MHASLSHFLKTYAAARANDEFKGDHPAARALDEFGDWLRDSEPVTKRPNIVVSVSVGKGNWSSVPWIALLDKRETKTTQRGRYVVLLFREDMSGFYLTVNQGVTELQKAVGAAAARKELRKHAVAIREQLLDLLPGFAFDDDIDLRADGNLGSAYESSTIAYKFYDSKNPIEELSFLNDLEAALTASDRIVGSTQRQPQQWGIYVAKGAAANFEVGLQRGIWGTKKATGVQGIQPGDEVLFVHDLTSDTNPPPSGFPRVGLKVFSGNAKRIVRARVATVFEDEMPVWSDDIYPHRFKFADVVEIADKRVSASSMDDGTRDAVRRSACNQGRAYMAKLVDAETVKDAEPVFDLAAIADAFCDALEQSNISYGTSHDDRVTAFVASLATKPFVILTGQSGSGKTQIAIRFGDWLGAQRCLVMPVRPDWTGPEAIFGYEDALQPLVNGFRPWFVPETLEFILAAAAAPHAPHLLVLDEMNLAHVERYFADIISGMESGKPVIPNLMRASDGKWLASADGQPRIAMPRNLFIVGTVNVDETTYMFSPKVLDRAFTFEFRVSAADLNTSAKKPTVCSPCENGIASSFLKAAHAEATWTADDEDLQDFVAAHLKRLHGLMASADFEFGHRAFHESLRLVRMMQSAGVHKRDVLLDWVVLTKLLPRLHGARRRLEPVLCSLAEFCVDPAAQEAAESPQKPQFDPLSTQGAVPRLSRSFEKLQRMTRSVRMNQFASFTD